MHNFVTKEIKCILNECLERQGWEIPETVSNHIQGILIEKMNKNPWQPEPSYAEAYMKTSCPFALLELGNTCWFTRAVFPNIGNRRGISSSYWVDLGVGCYARARKSIDNPTIEQMETHFEFIAEIAYTAIWSHGGFRNMWN